VKRILLVFLIAGSLLSVVSGCGGPHRKDPVALDLWHNYGGTMQETMDELLNTFNATIGKEQGIIVNVTSVNSLSVLQEKLLMIARGDPGAPESPDLVTCYPKVAIALAEKGLLADLDEYFSDEELGERRGLFLDSHGQDGRNRLASLAPILLEPQVPLGKRRERNALRRTLGSRRWNNNGRFGFRD